MQVSLVEITMDNFEECINLQVDDSQKGFVAANSYSLSEAFADKISMPYAIYANGQMVGFIMYDFDANKKCGYITRLMIDKRYQKNGYGRNAMQSVIQKLRDIPGCECIYTSYHKDNINAGRLYEQLGFVKTGEFTGNGEVICKLIV